MSSAIRLNQEPILLEDSLPSIGDTLPAFSLVTETLEEATLDTYAGKYKILHIFPSIDTPVSAESVLALETLVAPLENTVLLNISADLPFAVSRFRAANHLSRGIHLSTLRGRDMFKHYGVLMVTSKFAGLPARALMVADLNDRLIHIELVPELNMSPNYALAIDAIMQSMRAQNS